MGKHLPKFLGATVRNRRHEKIRRVMAKPPQSAGANPCCYMRYPRKSSANEIAHRFSKPEVVGSVYLLADRGAFRLANGLRHKCGVANG